MIKNIIHWICTASLKLVPWEIHKTLHQKWTAYEAGEPIPTPWS